MCCVGGMCDMCGAHVVICMWRVMFVLCMYVMCGLV